jgi:DtxR family Mn-dependent transcriptional regulator
MKRPATRPSATIEDYLQTVYSLETEGERAISARLARWMHVTPPTAWATVQRMQREGMVTLDAKKGIHLTESGRGLAENIARRHRLSERFLTDFLGLGWADAHEQAHHFEHGMTPVIEERIFKLLGNPTTCPHGSPIPGTGARLDAKWVALDQFAADEEAVIQFISEELEEDLDLLRYLDRHNIKPGKTVRIEEKVASAGVLSLSVDGQSVSLNLPVASRIRAARTKTAARRSA